MRTRELFWEAKSIARREFETFKDEQGFYSGLKTLMDGNDGPNDEARASVDAIIYAVIKNANLEKLTRSTDKEYNRNYRAMFKLTILQCLVEEIKESDKTASIALGNIDIEWIENKLKEICNEMAKKLPFKFSLNNKDYILLFAMMLILTETATLVNTLSRAKTDENALIFSNLLPVITTMLVTPLAYVGFSYGFSRYGHFVKPAIHPELQEYIDKFNQLLTSVKAEINLKSNTGP